MRGIRCCVGLLALLLATQAHAQAGGALSVSNFPATQTVAGTVTANPTAASLAVTALSAANTAVTATLPAVSGQFHYITAVRVVRTCTAALAGSAALAVTTTNLPGSLAWTMGNACAVGSTNVDVSEQYHFPLKSSVVNTATTIVCPAAGAAVVCRVTALYFTAP